MLILPYSTCTVIPAVLYVAEKKTKPSNLDGLAFLSVKVIFVVTIAFFKSSQTYRQGFTIKILPA